MTKIGSWLRTSCPCRRLVLCTAWAPCGGRTWLPNPDPLFWGAAIVGKDKFQSHRRKGKFQCLESWVWTRNIFYHRYHFDDDISQRLRAWVWESSNCLCQFKEWGRWSSSCLSYRWARVTPDSKHTPYLLVCCIMYGLGTLSRLPVLMKTWENSGVKKSTRKVHRTNPIT